MSTIDSKDIIKTILENNGFYPGDPQYSRVYEYTNTYGDTTWAIYLEYRYDDIYLSPYVINPILLFDKEIGLTVEGQNFLSKF